MNVSSKVGPSVPWTQPSETPAVQSPTNATAVNPAEQTVVDQVAAAVQALASDSFQTADAAGAGSEQWDKYAATGPTGSTVPTDNVFSQEQLEKGGWANDVVPTRQNNDIDCGAAVATMLGSAKNPTGTAGQQEQMDALQAKFGSADGTTPEQMTKMLANVGVEVRRGDSTLDQNALAGTLSMGGKAAALVDSNAIRPESGGEPGAAHWVVVDGMNSQGDYQVRDPSDGSTYYVNPDKLGAAMDTARAQHGGGGMLFVENAKADEQTLNTVGAGKDEALGKGPGTGSKAWKNSAETPW
ncbi:hypothetical protein [Melittangium boletus]|uniref:hypothetical protein n=1 Tax=Melittangium boletus TaxID=83453 RepID=UPI003DA4FE7C